MKTLQQKRKNQSGNMLVYILGAIILMGLLFVALKGSFQEGTGIDPEKNAMLVGQVQRYGAELERGVKYILDNGYSEADIRFAHPSADAGYGSISDNPARQVFSPEGGGVERQLAPTGSQLTGTTIPWVISARVAVTGVGSTCTGNECADLVLFMPNTVKEVCLIINSRLGITNPSGDAPVDPDDFSWLSPVFDGTFERWNYINTTGNYLDGRPEGCVKTQSTGRYYYYRVLLAR